MLFSKNPPFTTHKIINNNSLPNNQVHKWCISNDEQKNSQSIELQTFHIKKHKLYVQVLQNVQIHSEGFV